MISCISDTEHRGESRICYDTDEGELEEFVAAKVEANLNQ